MWARVLGLLWQHCTFVLTNHMHLFLSDSPSWSPDDLLSGDTPPMDAAVCVELLTSLPECWPVLEKLMRDKNLDGHTPFMTATACKVMSSASS